MSIQYYTFSADGVAPDNFSHQGRFSQISIGKEGAEDFGGGVLLIQKPTLDGGMHTVRQLTAKEFAGMKDKTLRLELPDQTNVFVKLTGSTSPDLYVEHNNQKDDRA